jgi:hypothetical protein
MWNVKNVIDKREGRGATQLGGSKLIVEEKR